MITEDKPFTEIRKHMYTLYIANKMYSSWSLRPWVLLKTRGIPFTEQLITFDAASNWEKFRAFSPNGCVPCLLHDGTAVWDSLAIIEHLAERHPGVWPIDDKARAWARSAAAEMHAGFSGLRNICPMVCGVRVALTTIPGELQRDIARIDELWQQGLNTFGGPYLASNDFSAVDAFFVPVAIRCQTYQLPLSAPSAAYAERLLNLPAVQDWYQAGQREATRESSHEADIQAAGQIIEDLRQS